MATKRFEEMLSFLQALKETSESSTVAATQEKMMRGCLKDLELGPPVSIAAAQTMLENLGKAGLPASMQSAIAAAISAKVAAPDAQAADPEARAQKPRKSQQCHRYLQHFLCESDWKSLQGHAAFQAKQQTLAKRLVAMGLTNPTEGTYVLGVAVLYLSQHAGPAETLQVSPQDALSTLEDLKGKLRAWAKRGTHSGLSEYPKEPKELPHSSCTTRRLLWRARQAAPWTRASCWHLQTGCPRVSRRRRCLSRSMREACLRACRRRSNSRCG